MRTAYALLCVLVIATYAIGLGLAPLRLPDEVREAELARESAARSPLSAPHLNGRPEGHAPLLAWAARPAFHGADTERPRTALLRALSALFVLGSAGMVFFLGRGWFSSEKGVLAALLFAMAPLASGHGRSFTPETATAFGVTVTVGSALLALRAVSGRRFLAYLGTGALGAALTLLASGLAGSALSLVIITVAIFAERSLRGLVTLRALSVLAALLAGTGIGLALVLPGLVGAEGGSLAGSFLKGSLLSLVRAPADVRAASLLERIVLPLGLLPALFFAFFAGRGRVHQLAPGGHPELPLVLLVAWAVVPITLAVALAGGAARALVLAALAPLSLLAASAILEPPRLGREAAFLQIVWLILRGLLVLALPGLLLFALPRWEMGVRLWDPAGGGLGLFPYALPLLLAVGLVVADRKAESERQAPLRSPFSTIGALGVLLLVHRAIFLPGLGRDAAESGAGFHERVEKSIGRPLDESVAGYALDASLQAAIAYERGAPLSMIDDPEAARAFLAAREGRRLLVPSTRVAALGGNGRLEAELPTPLGRVSIIRGDPMAPAPPTGTAAPK